MQQPFNQYPCQPCQQPCQPCQPCQPYQPYQGFNVQQGFNQPAFQQAPVESIIEAAEPPPSARNVQYIKVQRKVIDYVQQWVEQKVPVTRTVYDEKKVTKQVPVEKKVVDYYKVQTITDYVPQLKSVSKEDMVPVTKTVQTPKYIPIEKEIVHYPKALLDQINKGNVVLQPAAMQRLRNATVGAPLTTVDTRQAQSKSGAKIYKVIEQRPVQSFSGSQTFNRLQTANVTGDLKNYVQGGMASSGSTGYAQPVSSSGYSQSGYPQMSQPVSSGYNQTGYLQMPTSNTGTATFQSGQFRGSTGESGYQSLLNKPSMKQGMDLFLR